MAEKKWSTQRHLLSLGMSVVLLQKQIEKIRNIEKIVNQKNRKQIYELIMKKKLNITQIAKEVDLSYKNTFFHIKKLEALGLVRCKKQEFKQGQSVLVLPADKTLADIREDCIEEVIDELRQEIS